MRPDNLGQLILFLAAKTSAEIRKILSIIAMQGIFGGLHDTLVQYSSSRISC
jgi:hypothetical protein